MISLLNMLKLYNSLTRKKEKFVALSGKVVGVYSCGPTRKIYKVSYIGSFSSFRIVNMLPGDLRVAGCFSFYKIGWTC